MDGRQRAESALSGSAFDGSTSVAESLARGDISAYLLRIINLDDFTGDDASVTTAEARESAHRCQSMASHARKPSSRAALPRRSTRGPLDADDGPLSPSSPLASSTITSPHDTQAHLPPPQLSTTTTSKPSTAPPNNTTPPSPLPERDLSFLLEPNIYHPLSQLETPAPFRRPLPPPLPPSTPLSSAFTQLDTLLSECQYLQAAHLAGLTLISGSVAPTDQHSIFRLLAIRYSCLELSGNVALAAQEAKALEDLGSGFYYADPPAEVTPTATAAADGAADHEATEDPAPPPSSQRQEGIPPFLPKHIVPWHLRLQALRLQSIGFADPRRGVSALYDLATECREYLASSSTSSEQDHRELWAARLEEVGVRVVNALIEMGDLDCARRTLEGMRPADNEKDGAVGVWMLRKALLCLRMGLLAEARGLVEGAKCGKQKRRVLESLLAVAEERFDVAIELLRDASPAELGDLAALAKQNLAVALLYRGDIQRAKDVLEGLVEEGYSFQTLTVSLATIYDLTTDRSRELKLNLVDGISDKIAQQGHAQTRTFTNADFKL